MQLDINGRPLKVVLESISTLFDVVGIMDSS
uniref:Uncharacterized protein n=1 Tax=Rhizophora mucronata TaxID=61149 RepID=A0A2P2NBX6_RHIMU